MLCWFQRFSGQASAKGSDTSFPSQQLFILALCRICEPIAFMSIFPYVYYMVSSFHITEDDGRIAFYAGTVTAAFTFAEFSMGVAWGRISDKIGRKPVLIMGLVGTAISMIIFGFASSLPVALLARALGGMLNGNIGVLQTTVAELVTDKKQQPKAYSIMPFVWCLGSIIGPALGGALAQPCESYPQLFPRGTIFDAYPFLLPNLFCVIILLLGITVGILFLEETHAELKFEHDRGREIGQWLTGKLWSSSEGPALWQMKARGESEEASDFLFSDERPPPGYQSTENSPRLSSVKVPSPLREDQLDERVGQKQSRGFRAVFSRRVVFIVICYGILAYHSVSFDQLMPIFLSTPVSDKEPNLPFKFKGGLALKTKEVGFMLAVQGVYSMGAQLWLFPFVVSYFGTLRSYRFTLSVWPILYFVVPYLILLPKGFQIPAAYAALIGKITVHVMAFPSTAILLANSAPSSLVLGSINGVAASVASLARGFGPICTGYLHSKGLEWGYSGLAWWVCGIVCILGAIESFWIDDEDAPNQSEKPDSDGCESGLYNDVSEPALSRTHSTEELPLVVQPQVLSETRYDDIVDFDLDNYRSDSENSLEPTTYF